MNYFKMFFLVAVLSLGVLSSEVFAKIEVNPNFKGTLLITFPDGDIKMVDAGDPIPEIPSGSTLEVFSGRVNVTVTGDDELTLSCFSHDITLKDGASVMLQTNESGGYLTVREGSVKVENPLGVKTYLTPEDTKDKPYPITILEDMVPPVPETFQPEAFPGAGEQAIQPTAQVDLLGTPETGGLGTSPEVDSRGLDDSI